MSEIDDLPEAQWMIRAEKAEAEVARLNRCMDGYTNCDEERTKLRAEVARLRATMERAEELLTRRIKDHNDEELYRMAVSIRAALAKGGGDDAQG